MAIGLETRVRMQLTQESRAHDPSADIWYCNGCDRQLVSFRSTGQYILCEETALYKTEITAVLSGIRAADKPMASFSNPSDKAATGRFDRNLEHSSSKINRIDGTWAMAVFDNQAHQVKILLSADKLK